MHHDPHHQRGGKQQPSLVSRRDPDHRGGARPASDMGAHEENHYKAIYRDAAYYSSGRDWNDYAPAYHYGYTSRAEHRGQRFEDVETELAGNWGARKAESRLLWVEARGAVHDAWQHFDSTIPIGAHRRRTD